MTNELAKQEHHAPPIGALANAETHRATQEIQASLVIAKQFPRDEKASLDRILNACSREGLAAQSTYAYARGGTSIEGPSIRLAEAVAQHWGNLQFGFRELYRGTDPDGVTFSEVQAFAWDMESNTRRPADFRVRHWRDTRQGGYALKEERDIYELVANQAQRRVRSCILAVVPGDVIDDALEQCQTTLKASADSGPEAQKKLVGKFKELGVTREQIEGRIQRKLHAITPAQVINLRKVFASINDGMSEPKDWFDQSTLSAPINPFEKPEESGNGENVTVPEPTNSKPDSPQVSAGSVETSDDEIA